MIRGDSPSLLATPVRTAVRLLFTLGAMAAVGSAAAQSSVTLGGVADVAFRHVSNGGGARVNQIVSGAMATSRLVIRGVEDLGGDLSASFWLDAGFNLDNGTGSATNSNNQTSGVAAAPAGTQGLTFNRRSTVSLAGNWGELRLGRDVVPQYWNLSTFDPFGNLGVGASQPYNTLITVINPVTSVRASNSVGYLLPANLGGVYGQAIYYAGENLSSAGNSKDGTGYGGRVGYASGQFDVAVASGRTTYLAGDAVQTNVGGSWDFGVAKILAQYEWDSMGTTKSRGGLFGALIPMGPGVIRASYSTSKLSTGTHPTSDKLALGYVYNLSKRTALYTFVADVRNRNGAKANVFPGAGGSPAPNGSSRGIDVGMRHAF